MSVAGFCCSLPARPFGYKDGRGRMGMVRTTDIARRPVKLPARGTVVPIYSGDPSPESPPSPSPGAIIDCEMKYELELKDDRWLNIFKCVERFKGTDLVPASFDPVTDVTSKDVLIFPSIDVSVRLYLPNVVDLPSKKLPILVYFHGGGFVIESTSSRHYHKYLNHLAASAHVLIVSVNYRLAPEHPIPVPYEECMAALNWVVKHRSPHRFPEPALELSPLEPWLVDYGDFSQLFLAGDSSGGNITHYIAMRAHDGVNIKGIALLNPYFLGKKPLKNEDEVYRVFHERLWRLSSPHTEGLDDPLINPCAPGAPSLKGLKCKRVIVFVSGLDFLVGRGMLYYDALVGSGWGGVAAELVFLVGVGHVFFLDDYESVTARNMMTQLVAFLKG